MTHPVLAKKGIKRLSIYKKYFVLWGDITGQSHIYFLKNNKYVIINTINIIFYFLFVNNNYLLYSYLNYNVFIVARLMKKLKI